ncbi:MAG: hypothetical protein GY730_07415 [bacterium]|nr:hypothetical protein [bacterium]
MLTSFRNKFYQEVLVAYKKTGVHLLAYKNEKLMPLYTGDDPGTFYLIPKIADLLNISIDKASILFYATALISGASLALLFLFLQFKSWLARLICTIGIGALTYIACFLGDVYIAFPFIICSLAPAFIYFFEKKIRLNGPVIQASS